MHEGAFGAGIKEKQLDKFIQYVNKNLSSESFEKCYIADYVLNAQENNYDLLYALASHPEYFGNQIDEITVIIENISLGNTMVMGTNKDSIKISCNGIDYVRFKDTEFIDEVATSKNKTLTAKVRLNLNTWNGKTSLQCFVDDYEFKEDEHRFDF